MIAISLAEARELAPAEYDKCLEAADGSLRHAAVLRECADAPPPIRSILLANVEASLDVERDYVAMLEVAIMGAMDAKWS